jgi:hypothetical protein
MFCVLDPFITHFEGFYFLYVYYINIIWPEGNGTGNGNSGSVMEEAPTEFEKQKEHNIWFTRRKAADNRKDPENASAAKGHRQNDSQKKQQEDAQKSETCRRKQQKYRK